MKRKVNKLNALAVISSIIILISVIVTFIGAFIDYKEPMKTINRLLSNPYFSNIICSLGLVFIVFSFQLSIGKRKIKKDFRCNEIMDDLFDAIDKFDKILLSRKKDESDTEFIKNNKSQLYVIKLALSYKNNDLLIESLNQCFFFNLNFELLGIINNIKNRLPNIREERKISPFLNSAKNENIIFDDFDARQFIVDLKFLAGYWKSLLNYIGYDNSYTQLVLEYYNRYFADTRNIDDISIRMKMIQMTFDKEIKEKIKKQNKAR